METILVPTDFSATAKNAALYALKLADQLKIKKIILYNAYQAPPILTEATIPVMPMLDIDSLRDISNEGMKNFKNQILAECPVGVLIEDKTAFAVLSDEIKDITKDAGADLIVIGISGTSKMEEMMIGSTATSIMKHAEIPVIIIPEDVKSNHIKNILFACDYKKVLEPSTLQYLKKMLDATGAKLHVVNFYENKGEINSDKMHQQEVLVSQLENYQPKIHSIYNPDFVEGINAFVEEYSIDLVISVPKKHGFFEGIFKESHSKQLAFHSHVPMMFIH